MIGDSVRKLIGKILNKEIREDEVAKIAKGAGYSIYQFRESDGVYDCQFNTQRLQVHVDANKKIVELREG